MKIISNYTSNCKFNYKLKSGDIVFMRGSESTISFYGIYVFGIGIVELENGSTAYANTKDTLYIGSQISYWTVEKVFKNCELIIKE